MANLTINANIRNSVVTISGALRTSGINTNLLEINNGAEHYIYNNAMWNEYTGYGIFDTINGATQFTNEQFTFPNDKDYIVTKLDTAYISGTYEVLPSSYSITYVENGGTTQTDLTEQTSLPNPLPIPTKENHTFLGWYYDSDFTNEAFTGGPLTGDVILYAKWGLTNG